MWNHAALDKWYKFVLLSGSQKLVRALEISTFLKIFHLFRTLIGSLKQKGRYGLKVSNVNNKQGRSRLSGG